jgi:hypothetical protein
MANIAFTITIDDAEVLVAQGQLATRLAHMTPVIEDIGRALGNLIEDAFQHPVFGWVGVRNDPHPPRPPIVGVPSSPQPTALLWEIRTAIKGEVRRKQGLVVPYTLYVR